MLRGAAFAKVVMAASVLLAAAEAASAERRVALVVGNGAYRHANVLPNPRNDAEDVAAALKRSGFETVVGLDLDKAGMEEMSIRFARLARDADVALFYYSGHAMQFGGVNYLMPVDARLNDETDLRRMTRVDDVVADLQNARTLRILVLDSCRDNPLAEALKRSIGRTRSGSIASGLAKIDSPQGMIVAYATQAGRTADDGDGRNSPYTAAFLKHIESQEEIGTVFRRVSADVYAATRQSQLPELSLSVIGEFYLRGRAHGVAVGPPAPAPRLVPVPSNEDARAWDAIKDSTSPAALQAFMARFPDSFYAVLARERLEKLGTSQSASRPPAAPAPPPPAPVTGVDRGFTVVPLTASVRRQYRIRGQGGRGVLVTSVKPGTSAARSGLRSGALIVQIARHPVASANDVETRLDELRKSGQSSALLMLTDGNTGMVSFVTLPLR